MRRMCNSFYPPEADREETRLWTDDDGNRLLYWAADCMQCFGNYCLADQVPEWLDEDEGDEIVYPDLWP